MTDLKSLLMPVSRFVKEMDLTDSAKAEAELNKKFPAASEEIGQIKKLAEDALAAGTICNRGETGMKFSRVVKPQDDAGGCSIDAVFMENSSGPVHTHTKGEVCLCIPKSGAPKFEGRGDTWIVMRAGSRHVPTVQGGAMLIIYWWPEGAVAWN
ncbi:MAG: DUF4863 family protein [Planctomycetes bacterium]|nr:DUF4863 family protein [Planctomycetota bacterium]